VAHYQHLDAAVDCGDDDDEGNRRCRRHHHRRVRRRCRRCNRVAEARAQAPSYQRAGRKGGVRQTSPMML